MNLITISGQQISLTDPDPATIKNYDICHALSFENRYNGHTMQPYSVGQHTLAIVDYLEAIDAPVGTVQVGLIHDFPEYVLGDVSQPLKRLLGDKYTMLETAWENAICAKYGVITGEWYRAIFNRDVKHIDQLAYQTEARMLTNHHIPEPACDTMHECFLTSLDMSPDRVSAKLAQRIEEYLT